jgi:hypothetical protein
VPPLVQCTVNGKDGIVFVLRRKFSFNILNDSADPLHAQGLVLHQMGKYKEAIDNIVLALKIVEREVWRCFCNSILDYFV